MSLGVPPPETLTIERAGTGSGTVVSSPSGISCGSACVYGFAVSTSVRLTATPAAGSAFYGWSGACSGTGACALTMDQTYSVTATFVKIHCVVPRVRGKKLTAAERAMTAGRCEIGKVRRVFSRTVRKGRVISEKPGGGRTLPDGAKVALAVSKGKRK